ncbi:MAG TPA: ATP synthase subunit I [Acidimicrobiales bacterium]|nr:ATP synthase subunit I [Acidimicrobiales bacterium]
MIEGFVDLDAGRLGRALRRTRVSAALLGVIGLAVAAVLGYPWVGLGIALGLVLAAINTRWVDTTVARLKNVEAKAARRPLAARTLGRLALTTAVVLALLFLDTPMGFGALGGLVLYQAAFLSNMLSAVVRSGVGP